MEQVDKILNIFEGFRMPPSPADQYNTVGKDVLARKLYPYVLNKETIPFVMLGFPMKSGNDRDKVLGKLPDMAEQAALYNFKWFDNRIKDVYSPGIKITIANDGFAFNDLLEIKDSVVEEYKEGVLDMARNVPLEMYDMRDFYSKRMSLNAVRDKLTEQFGITEQELERRILYDPDVNSLYRGMIIFMMEEKATVEYPSGNQRQKAAKFLTRQMMLRNEAYSAIVSSEFPHHIRLSMHPSVNNGKKYSFQMIENAHHSAWHSAVLMKEDGWITTMHKKDAIAAGYELVTKDGRPYYFTA